MAAINDDFEFAFELFNRSWLVCCIAHVIDSGAKELIVY
jgi:hypothetical protein